MTQLDLLQSHGQPTPSNVCGTCVVWNALPGDRQGGCSVHGERLEAAPACERWFGLEHLRKGLYGRNSHA